MQVEAAVDHGADEGGLAVLVNGASVDAFPDGAEERSFGEAAGVGVEGL